MADENKDLIVSAGLEFDTGKDTTDKAKKAGEEAGKKFGDEADKSAASSFGSLKRTIATIAATVGAGLLFRKMIANATEAEDAVNSLNQSMKLTGTFTAGASEAYQEYASMLQKTTGISDDFITKQGAVLVSIGRLEGEGLRRATKAALDFSAATGKDLGGSFDLMAKAANGNVAMLKRYGIEVDASTPKSERFGVALAQLEARFGGLAEGKLNTFSGSIMNLSNAFNDLLEEFGKLFTQSPVLRAIINEFAKMFYSAADAVKAFGGSGDVVGNLIMKLLDVAKVVTQYVLPPLELLYNIGNFVFKSIASAIQEMVIVPLAAVANGIGMIGQATGLMSKESAAALAMFSDSAKGVATQLNTETKAALGDMFNFDATLAAEGFVMRMTSVAEAAKPITDQMKNQITSALGGEALIGVSEGFMLALEGMGNAAQEFADKAGENFKNIGKSMFTSVGQGAGQAFAAFGKAVASGENALQAFLNSLLASMGQMAIQLGTQFILQGIAYTWAGMPNGPALIGAGAALAAFGGVLSAVGGGGGSTVTAASGGGAGDTGMAPELGGSEEDVVELDRKPETNITVQVQGNIMDRRQTGLELAEVIQETFGTNGINYNT